VVPREKLLKEREQVEADLARLRAELQEAPEATGDEVDLSVYDREKTLALVAAYERRLEELDDAIRAAEKGEYGICERCGKEIDRERLKIFPETRLCVNCKNEMERAAKRRLLG
jgi:DnaK suppressor protein